MNAPIYCRTNGQRIGTCRCLRCVPPKQAKPTTQGSKKT